MIKKESTRTMNVIFHTINFYFCFHYGKDQTNDNTDHEVVENDNYDNDDDYCY